MFYWQCSDGDSSKRRFEDKFELNAASACSADEAANIEAVVRSAQNGEDVQSITEPDAPAPIMDVPAAVPGGKATGKGKGNLPKANAKSKAKAKAKTDPKKEPQSEEDKQMEALKKELSSVEQSMSHEIKSSYVLLDKADKKDEPWVKALTTQDRCSVFS